MVKIMKKILFLLLCLFIVSISVSAAFASSDVNAIADNDSIQISHNPVGDISIQDNMTSPGNVDPDVAIAAEPCSNQTISSNDLVENTTNNNTPKLNITGPKINGSNLNISGPKITGKGPVISLSQKDKDTYHFAKVFMEHPNWDLYDCIDYVRHNSDYNWRDTCAIVTNAHNIALHNYHGEEFMIIGWELKLDNVIYRSQNYYGWK